MFNFDWFGKEFKVLWINNIFNIEAAFNLKFIFVQEILYINLW